MTKKIKEQYEEYDFKGYKGVPTKIIYDITKGAKRKPPYKYMDNIVLKGTAKVLTYRAVSRPEDLRRGGVL